MSSCVGGQITATEQITAAIQGLFLLDAATALSALQIENQALRNAASGFKAENEKLREMYQKEKAVCHATQAELDQMKRENETLKHALQNWHEED